MRKVIASLDIGSHTIKLVVGEIMRNKLNILACVDTPSRGIKKGFVVNPESAIEALSDVFKKGEEQIGLKITKVIVSCPTNDLECFLSEGYASITNEEHIVTGADIIKSMQTAVYNKVMDNREIVGLLPTKFLIDDSSVTNNPLHMHAEKLKVKVVVATVPKKNVYSVLSLLENIGIEVVDISINNIGDLYAFRTKNFSDKLAAIINIGSDTTSVSIFNRSVIVKSTVLALGGKSIDLAISSFYNIDNDDAIKMKHKYAVADVNHAQTNDTIECKNKNGEVIKINQYEISEMVSSRIKEILNLSKNELNNLTSKRIDYIIITGGMSNMAGFEYAASDIFGKDVNIGTMKMLGVRNNKYSSVVGNIVYFISKLKLKGKNYSMIDDGEYSVMTHADSTRNAPDSTLGKIFGYFFND